MKNLPLLLFIILPGLIIAQEMDSLDSKVIYLDTASNGKTIKTWQIAKDKKLSEIKSLAEMSNDSLSIEFLYILQEEYWTYHVAIKKKGEKVTRDYIINYDFVDSFINQIEIHESKDLLFTAHIEKHNNWVSNYEKGKSLEKGIMLFKILDNRLFTKHFTISSERVGVDYRTGSFNEKKEYDNLEIDKEVVIFSSPMNNSRKLYKIHGSRMERIID